LKVSHTTKSVFFDHMLYQLKYNIKTLDADMLFGHQLEISNL